MYQEKRTGKEGGMNWKIEWEKEKKEQRDNNLFTAVVFGLFALPAWIIDVKWGIVITAFWGLVLLLLIVQQPHTYEEFAKQKQKELENKRRHPTPPTTPTRYSFAPSSTSMTAGPSCPKCGSRNVRKLSGIDVDVDAVDTFVEMNDNIWPVCLHDYMCCQCKHKW